MIQTIQSEEPTSLSVTADSWRGTVLVYLALPNLLAAFQDVTIALVSLSLVTLRVT